MSNFFPFATITDARNYANSGIWNWRSDDEAARAAEIFYRADSEEAAINMMIDENIIDSTDAAAWMANARDDDYFDYDSLAGYSSDDDE